MINDIAFVFLAVFKKPKPNNALSAGTYVHAFLTEYAIRGQLLKVYIVSKYLAQIYRKKIIILNASN